MYLEKDHTNHNTVIQINRLGKKTEQGHCMAHLNLMKLLQLFNQFCMKLVNVTTIVGAL